MLALSVTLLSLAVAEIGLRWFHPLPDPYRKRRTWHPYLPTWIGAEGEETVLNTRGLHGVPYSEVKIRRSAFSYTDGREELALRPKSPDEFRVICIGGSTTECYGLDLHDSWPGVLQTLLQKEYGDKKKVSCANLGVVDTPLKTYLATLAHYGIHLQPDVAILLVGVNDLGLGVKFPDDPTFEVSFDPFSRNNLGSSPEWQNVLATRSQLGRHLRLLVKPREPLWPRKDDPRFFAGHTRSPASCDAVDLSFTFDPAAVRQYAANLRSAAGVCQSNGCRLLVLTGPTLWRTDKMTDEELEQLWVRPKRGANRVLAAATCRRMLDARNEMTRSVCREANIPCLDLAAMVPSSLEYFYDDVHFNVAGARFVAGKIAKELLSARFARDRSPNGPAAQKVVQPLASGQ
jgi:lysophospholipase L1-like esterase